jgi:hypothetical protein
MTQIQFHETYMGAQFYRKTLPELVKQLTRVADAMERLAAAGEGEGADCSNRSENPSPLEPGGSARPE